MSLPASPEPDTEDLKRELQATLSARRELGTEYDDHFIDRLVERLTARTRQEMASVPRPHAQGLSSDQRTGIAICSLIFGIPLVAIAGGVAGSVGLVVAFVSLVLLNLATGINW